MQLFVTGFLLSLSLSLDLGTVNVAMVRTALQHGARPSFLLGIGSCLGDLVYALISLLAVAALLQSLAVRWALWVAGTLILLFLAAKMLREALTTRPDDPAAPEQPILARSAAGYVLQGIGLAMSSPSAILWFATVGGSIIAASASGQAALVPFFTGFFLSGVAWSAMVAWLGGQGRKRMGASLLRACALGSALLFLLFAAKVFLEGYNTLIAG